ncbi:flagellar hook-associated protein 1 [Geomonas sp. Red276]
MSISSLFDIAASGVAAQRFAMEVTGENIANVNTTGYARQQVMLQTGPITTGSNGFPMASGVEVQGVRRAYDGMLQQQIVNGNSTYQQNLTRQSALEQIQPSLNELSTDGLGSAVAKFFSAWHDLSTNPGGTAERQALMTATNVMTDDFHQVSSTLSGVAQNADTSLVGMTANLTGNAKDLALVNQQIIATTAVGGNANELLNQRDQLIQQMSQTAGITSTINSDGTATVTLAGGDTLVNSTKYATVYTNTNASGKNDILITGIGNPSPANAPASDTNISATVGGPSNSQGTIGGALQVRDSIVPGYLSSLNEMASQLVSTVNTQHKTGYALDGTSGNNFFDPAGTTAANIAIDPTLTVQKIAAGLPTATDPIPTSANNNGNALAIANLQKSQVAFTTGNATFSSYYNALVAKVGVDTQSAQNTTTQGQSFLNQLNNLWQSNAGVSLDEELTNLTRYQQAFQGSAKVINVATSMLDTVLDMVR